MTIAVTILTVFFPLTIFNDLLLLQRLAIRITFRNKQRV